jgi:glycosyltransferase involved in cell wall biosynthesis
MMLFEYANRLTARGHEVTIVQAPSGVLERDRSLRRTIRRGGGFIGRWLGLRGGHKPGAWFQVDPKVRMRWVPSLHPRWVPDSDAVVAGAWGPAEWVSEYPDEKGTKFYLIQAQESIFPEVDPVRVVNTWRLPLQKIVIARWLQDIAITLGESAVYIPCGLDFDVFGLDTPISERSPWQLIMLYHKWNGKGSREGLEAVRTVQQEVPQLRLTLFGVPERPKGLPEWSSYWQKPHRNQLRQLYNEAAIFVGPSWSEGWGLPGSEAAQCGAALCVTDNGGHREYAIQGRTALLSPPKDPEALAANIKRLIDDSKLRIGLAMQGHRHVQQFTWDRAVSAFEQVLQENVD